MKRVLDQFDARVFVFWDHNFNNVEAKRNVRIIEHAEPGKGSARNSAFLITPQIIDRPFERVRSASLYFDEDQGVVIAANDVDLTAASMSGFEIPIKNFVAVPAQVASCKLFAPRSAGVDVFGSIR